MVGIRTLNGFVLAGTGVDPNKVVVMHELGVSTVAIGNSVEANPAIVVNGVNIKRNTEQVAPAEISGTVSVTNP